MNHTFSEQLKHYENKWIAYLRQSKEIVGSGEDAAQAIEEATKKGYSDVVLYKVLPFNTRYIPAL